MKNIQLLIITIIAVSLFSCADSFVNTEPTDRISGHNIINDIPSAQSTLYGTYSGLQSGHVYGGFDVFTNGMWADNLVHTGSYPSLAQINANNPVINNRETTLYWNQHYSTIFRANYVIEKTNLLKVDDLASKARIIAEAKAIRALMYYKLVKVYGGVPLVLDPYTTVADIDNNPQARATVTEVYNQILQDATDAVTDLGQIESTDIYTFNVNSARVLKAKIEMEIGEYEKAEETLNPVLGKYQLATSYADLFPESGFANSQETIFAIPYSNVDGNIIGHFFLKKGRYEVGASESLISSFVNNDLRKSFITEEGEVIKYSDADSNNGKNDIYVFRYADVLLMKAELAARRDAPTASTFLNQVRIRAGLNELDINSTNFSNVIERERRTEFFAETADRFFTITRLGIADDIIEAKANNVFIKERNNLWPIPQEEIERNPLISVEDQNPGY